jgi:hypothetical protein
MALAYQLVPIVFNAAASITQVIPQANQYRRHQIGVVTAGGQWTAQVQWTDGVVWYDLGPLLTLNGESETIEIEGVYPSLRLVLTRTGGTCTASAIQSWSTPMDA